MLGYADVKLIIISLWSSPTRVSRFGHSIWAPTYKMCYNPLNWIPNAYAHSQIPFPPLFHPLCQWLQQELQHKQWLNTNLGGGIVKKLEEKRQLAGLRATKWPGTPSFVLIMGVKLSQAMSATSSLSVCCISTPLWASREARHFFCLTANCH